MSCEEPEQEPEPKSIREFVDYIAETEITEAKDWMKEFKRIIPSWSSYSSLATTESAVENIAFSISGQISRQLRILCYNLGQSWQELAQKGHRFLREIHQKAVEMGLEVDLSKIDCILEPDMAESKQP